MLEKTINEIEAEISLTLQNFNCNLVSTYDYSHVIVYKEENEKDFKRVKGTSIFSNYSFYEDDEDDYKKKLENKHKFDICKKELELIAAKYKVKIDTTYDMSHVLIIDSYGNSERFK